MKTPEDFLIEKGISNHPYIYDSITGKQSYELEGLLDEYASYVLVETMKEALDILKEKTKSMARDGYKDVIYQLESLIGEKTDKPEIKDILPKVKCICGESYMEYTVVGEDMWKATSHNTTIKESGYGCICVCDSCGNIYDNYDPCMVKISQEKNKTK